MTTDSKSIKDVTITSGQEIFLSWTKDVLIYILVLNLFVEYNSKIVIDSFTISIFTAIVLKILLDIILRFEHIVGDFFKARPGKLSNFLRIISTWVILFLSKFLILEVIDLIFGDHVELGKLLDVIVLVISLMVAREVFQRIYLALGERAPATT
ncbi:hypothetical protein ACFLV7_10915 [Chloroflexota bacterium]